ncbi:Peptidase_C39 like family protein [Actinokineospora alba]|uniref:Peptidase_C39 like family protein n=1 Tax=Actinokineospora alba TaxID=504798 RepID=A0A1H0FI02_9PSEU|nr:C39 family peptidase [Actinokineospora alba]TDP69488.1 peptidase C39-like protein [Actinokineospora alba]SDI15626.1 Peptidase_C39 like family protein [Actinokineospora alba]SDN94297.1 Peptidase_C39 like family protein [Actinokineospora alba]
MSRRPRFAHLLTVTAILLAGLITTAAPASAATSKVLSYQFQWQENYYFCGPAATRMALTSRGIYHSQSFIAGRLGTTTNGTNSAADTTRVLNNLGNTWFYETKWIPGQSATQAEINRLQWDVVYDIDRGYPIVANVVGSAMDTDGDWHTYSGGHYLTIIGYGNNGWTVKLADSADANGYGWYWMDTTRMAHWIAARGYSA